MEDRWQDALVCAERAWEINPGSPFGAETLGTCLLNLRKVEQSAPRLERAAEGSQSYQLVLTACWHQCTLAEMLDGESRQSVLQKARVLAEKLHGLAPLIDRESRAVIAHAHLDIAGLADDTVNLERWANEVRSPFHRQVLANLTKTSEGKRFRLNFRRAVQKYQECLPTSIASAMSATGLQVDSDEMATEITFGGTPEWSAGEWLRRRGFYVRFFPVSTEVARQLLNHKIGFVISWESDDAGHAVACIGLDERAGTLLIHDPQSFRTTEYLFSVFKRVQGPLGVKGMAIVSPSDSSLLDSLMPSDAPVMEAAQEHRRLLTTQGPSSARVVVSELQKQFPTHPGTSYLNAAQLIEEGHVGEALQQLLALVERFPASPALRIGITWASRALGNTALLRQTLAEIVETGVLPGTQSQQDWDHPPDRYVYEYADLLRLSAETRCQGKLLLHSLLRRHPMSAGAWHVLADLLWQEREFEESLLSFRLASCLATSNEHYARAYAEALAGNNRIPEALAWLEARVRKHGHSTHAVDTWITWIAVLEERGMPERALEVSKDALEKHRSSPELLAFIVPFFGRMGEWEQAEKYLSQLRELGNASAFCEAATHFCRMRGELQAALQHAAAWMSESPRSEEARREYLDLLASFSGSAAAVERARSWLKEKIADESFEQMYFSQVERLGSSKGKIYSLLLHRLKRNHEDAWAWREGVFALLSEFEMADDRRRPRLQSRILRFLGECDRTSHEAAANFRAHALWSECQGDWQGAVDLLVTSIEVEPENVWSYRRVFSASSRLSADKRAQLWTQIEPLLLKHNGRLTAAREVMALLVERFGAIEAEKTIRSWAEKRPDDPEILEANADLLIEHGQGRSDAARALAILEPGVKRFPYHSGLRFSLSSAKRALGAESEAEQVLLEIVRRHPNNSPAKVQLAWLRYRDGDTAKAHSILVDAITCDPRNPNLYDARAQMLLRSNRYDETTTLVECVLQLMPEDVHWRSRAIDLLSQCNEPKKAIETARSGVTVYPRGAYLWLLLGRSLNQMREYAAQGEIDQCLRRSLQLNSRLFEAADLLSIFLTEQKRHMEAAQVMRNIEGKMADPSAALGRLAWINREQQLKREAVQELHSVLVAAPWYGWGWGVLIEWLGEDKDWDKAKVLLREIPAQMRTNLPFRLNRLQLLEKSGIEPKRLDVEWNELLGDFPEDVSLHLRRYDSLESDNRREEAATVLAAVRNISPDDPFMLARYVEVLLRSDKKTEAVETGVRICLLPAHESVWPVDRVWELFAGAALDGKLNDHLYEHLKLAQKPARRAFGKMCAYAMKSEIKQRSQPWIRIWFPRGGARNMMTLFDSVNRLSSEAGNYRSDIYATLCEYGYQRLVRRCWNKEGGAVPVGVEEWAQVGRALVGAKFYSQARQYFRNWRQRTGVAMWMVTNYTLCLSRFNQAQLREVFESSRGALSSLPHDHCGRYLAHVHAESCALRGDSQSLLSVWNTYREYFTRESKPGSTSGLRTNTLSTKFRAWLASSKQTKSGYTGKRSGNFGFDEFGGHVFKSTPVASRQRGFRGGYGGFSSC